HTVQPCTLRLRERSAPQPRHLRQLQGDLPRPHPLPPYPVHPSHPPTRRHRVRDDRRPPLPLRHRPPALPRQIRGPRPHPRRIHVPRRRPRHPAVPVLHQHPLAGHLPSPDHPRPLLRTTPVRVRPRQLLHPNALGTRTTRQSRRRLPRTGLPHGHPPPRRPRTVHRRNPGLPLRLERIPAGQPTLQRQPRRLPRHLRHRLLQRIRPPHRALHLHHGRRRHHHHPARDRRAALPTPHHLRPHRRRRQRLNSSAIFGGIHCPAP